jgi:hypothetical protein
MATLAEFRHQLLPNQPTATHNDDSHGLLLLMEEREL